LRAGDGLGLALDEVVDVHLGDHGNFGALTVGIVDDVFAQLEALPFLALAVVQPAVDPRGVEEEQGVGFGVDGMPVIFPSKLPGTPLPPSISTCGTGEVGIS